MVEFAMTFVFFIFVTIAIINLILLAYNFNLAQRVSWEVARKAALGAPTGTLKEMVYDDLITKFFASPFLVSAMEWDSKTLVSPEDRLARVQGEFVTINFAYRAGFSFLEGGGIYAQFPIQTKLLVLEPNDADRDGFYDTSTISTLADTRTSNHDADLYINDVDDPDDDNDDLADGIDYGELMYNSTLSRYEYSVPALGIGFTPLPNGRDVTGLYFARVINVYKLGDALPDSTAYRAVVYPARPQVIPRNPDPNPATPPIILRVDLSYDVNNDAWEDMAD